MFLPDFESMVTKDGLVRSPDLVSRPKNRIFDQHRLREVEYKNLSKSLHLMTLSNFMKAVKIWQQHPVLEGLLKFLLLRILKLKNFALRSFRF